MSDGVDERDSAQYYLESHITIEPVFDERQKQAEFIAGKYDFKMAHLLMQKERASTAERSNRDSFLTGHSKSRTNIQTRTMNLVADLQNAGFKVWRYKIEDTLIDSKFEDVWHVLGADVTAEQRATDEHVG